jgi:hypothetical protein
MSRAGNGWQKEISLDGIAAQFPEPYCCFPVLHAFGNTGDTERLGEVDVASVRASLDLSVAVIRFLGRPS